MLAASKAADPAHRQNLLGQANADLAKRHGHLAQCRNARWSLR